MNTAHICLLIACLLPGMTIALAKSATFKLPKEQNRYDNNNPRAWAARLTGWQQRAHAAHLNGFEALPLFIAGVILAEMAHVDQGRVDMLALSFVILRIVYVATYLMNLGILRSVVWFAATGVSIALLAMA
jgi:uncharacterized MAPEG superfamily protein